MCRPERIATPLIATASGACAAFGWAPTAWWPLAALAYGALYLLVRHAASPWKAASIGALFGAGLHLVGHGWCHDALHLRVGWGPAAAALGTAVFVAYLALFTALPCLAWQSARRRLSEDSPLGLELAGASTWSAFMALGEYIRGGLFNGFTSLSFGYALIDTPLAGWAPVVGIFGVSLWGFCLVSATAVVAWHRPRQFAVPLGVVAVATLIGHTLQGVTWTSPSGRPLTFRLVQEHLPQHRKFDPRFMEGQAAMQTSLITAEPADLVLTSETAFPMPLWQLPAETLERLKRFGDSTDTHVLLGTVTLSAEGRGHNSLVHLAPRTAEHATYRKVRLMPFGEYGPAGFEWATRQMHVALNDLQPGPARQDAFLVRGQSIGTLLCNEIQLGELARAWVLRETSVLVNPGNMAWFEGSWASAQHQQMARMRALEMGRPVLRSSNTGAAAAIDHLGVVTAELPEDVRGALAGQVQGRSGLTPFARFGDAAFISTAALLFAFGLLGPRRRTPPARRSPCSANAPSTRDDRAP